MTIELSAEHMGGALEVLEEGRVDLAVTSRNVDARSIEAEPFTCVAISAVAHRDHPIARVRGPVPSSALREHLQIVLSDSARKQLGPSINVIEAGLRWNVSDVSAKSQCDEHLHPARDHRRAPTSARALSTSSTVETVALSAPAGISIRTPPRCTTTGND